MVTLSVLGGLCWLAGTTAGAAWLLDAVSRHTALQLSARAVEGRLVDHLHLAGLRFATPGVSGEIADLELRWQPIYLLSGEVAVSEFKLRGVQVRDDRPSGGPPPELVWPRVSGVPARLHGRVDRLLVEGVDYRRASEAPVTIDRIAASLDWRDQILTVGALAFASPAGQAAGTLMAGFRRPYLRLDGTFAPPSPVAGMDRFALSVRLHPGRGDEQMAGALTLFGASGARRRLDIAGGIGVSRTSLAFRRLRASVPGRRGAVTGNGTLSLAARQPLLKGVLTVAGLDLSPETGVTTDIAGTISFEGGASGYRGWFDLANAGKGWRNVTVAGHYTGDTAGMQLELANGSLLAGAGQGSVLIDWRDGVSLSGAFKGRRLDPARISPDWHGVINVDLDGKLRWRRSVPLAGAFGATLLDSTLHGRALTGAVRANLADGTLRIGRLDLQGRGFDIHAAGELGRRLTLSARVADLSRLMPDTAGEARLEGWVRRQNGHFSGAATLAGRDVAAAGVRVASADLSARLDEGEGYPLHLRASIRGLARKRFRLDAASITADGTLQRHAVTIELRSGDALLQAAATGGYRDGRWQGEIARGFGHDSVGPWRLTAPAPLTVNADGVSCPSLTLAGVAGERISVAGTLTRNPFGGALRLQWKGVHLDRVDPWLADLQLTGRSDGSVRLRILPDDRIELAAGVRASGSAILQGHRVTVTRAVLDASGDVRGMHAALDVELANGAGVKGSVTSDAPARLGLPREGNVALRWTGVDLALLHRWLPKGMEAEGVASGNVAGRLNADGFDLSGDAALAQGKVLWKRPGGELKLSLRSAATRWHWAGEALDGSFDLALADRGQAKGRFRLPLPARAGAGIERRGPVRASLTGRFREEGIVTALFPSFIRESHGDLDVDLHADGSWDDPRFGGELRLSGAGAYLPTVGIQLKAFQLDAHLEGDEVRIDAFRATSGPGQLSGTAVIRTAHGRVTGYRGTIDGDRFRVVYLPELQMLCTPHLTFDGTPERLTVRGDVKLPELMVTGPPGHATVTPSEDVVIEGAPQEEQSSPFALAGQVRVEFGDHVLVKTEGIDAQMGGTVDLTFHDLRHVTSRGEIRVLKGRYKTYGVDLDIERGRLFYTGGPVAQPTLDILALRTVGDVKAGVTVAGTLRSPVVKLYSQPTMPDVDILSYIVLGQPMGSGGEKANLMAQAAGVLLSTGQSVVLQDQIKQRLGLSTLEIQSGSGETGSHMGYTPVQVTPPGSAPATTSTGVAETILTVGKYLTPSLYVSYGRSIFTGSNLVRLRYNFFRQWEVEAQTGGESGVDLYYKLDLR